MKQRFLVGLVCAIAVTGCNKMTDNAAAPTDNIARTTIGINLSAMDTSVAPGDNFYLYANGQWQKKVKIPDDRASVGAFLVAFNRTEHNKEQLIDELLKQSHDAGSKEAKIVAFYQAYTDRQAIDAAGTQPLKAVLTQYRALNNKQQLSAVLGETLHADVDPMNATDYNTENLFGLFASKGPSADNEVLPYLLQGGLGLPDRAYYLSDDPKMVKLRQQYHQYIATLLDAAGIDQAQQRADRVFALETKIASAHVSSEQNHDFAKSATNLWQRSDFASKAPGIDWQAFMRAARLEQQSRFIAYDADAIIRLSALVASEPLVAWQDWLIFHQINQHADVLPSAIDDAHFAFYGTTLSGVPQQRPRSKQALQALDQYLGDAVGQDYVAKYFPPAAKAKAEQMVKNILQAYHQRIEALPWMTASTKKEALAKLKTLTVSVGYPEHWQDYRDYQVSAQNAYGNEIAGEQYRYQQQLAKLGQPQQKDEWWLTPQTVNALNLPLQNTLNFPAAILQPPFFDANADNAYNYGAIGAVIGHEISHSFDNNGAAFDSTGALRNWWTAADFAHFAAQGKALAQQFDAYAPFPDLHLNGTLTLGENIADLAGLAASFDAYRASLAGKPAAVVDDLTGNQRFFISFDQVWSNKMRPATLRRLIATNEHAPGQYRALTVRNIDAWYQAFEVVPGDALYLAPEQRVKIW